MNDLWQLFSPPLLLADMTLAPAIEFGEFVAVISSSGVVIIEAIVFYRCGWTLGKAFLDAFLLNLASTIAGCVIYPLVLYCIYIVFVVLYNSTSQEITQILIYLLCSIIFIISFFGTVAIEYYILTLLRGMEDRIRFKRSVVIANLWSYGVMFVFINAVFFSPFGSFLDSLNSSFRNLFR